jgi:hypothetical protein
MGRQEQLIWRCGNSFLKAFMKNFELKLQNYQCLKKSGLHFKCWQGWVRYTSRLWSMETSNLKTSCLHLTIKFLLLIWLVISPAISKMTTWETITIILVKMKITKGAILPLSDFKSTVRSVSEIIISCAKLWTFSLLVVLSQKYLWMDTYASIWRDYKITKEASMTLRKTWQREYIILKLKNW